jgi:hypothetical protein
MERCPSRRPQGTKLGPWLFVLMIDNIDVTDNELWKFVDDTTTSETVHKTQMSVIQNYVSEIVTKSHENKLQLNEDKCKELRISFAKEQPDFTPIIINGKELETVPNIKLFGLNIQEDLKWNCHVSEIIRKASSRLYFLRQLKRANVPTKELLTFYTTCVRPVTEYACAVFHNSLAHLSADLERLQKRALRTIYPQSTYANALISSNLTTLYERRNMLTVNLFNEIVNNENHKLYIA